MEATVQAKAMPVAAGAASAAVLPGDIDDGPVLLPRIGDPQFWAASRAHPAFGGWSDFEVITTIWPPWHEDALAKAQELRITEIHWVGGRPTLTLIDDAQ